MSKKHTSVFAAVAAAFQSLDFTVAAANATDKQYNVLTGNPSGHMPFTAEDSPQMVAMNCVGPYAADTLAHIMAGPAGNEDAYLAALKRIANGTLSDNEAFLANVIANIGWRAGQPFRDIGTKPLNRISRSVNMPWFGLPAAEQAKDLPQTQLGAKLLLDWIAEHMATETAAETAAV